MTGSRLRVLVLGDSRSFHIERYVAELRRQGCHVLLASLEQGSVHHYSLKRRGFFGPLHYVLAATEVRAVADRFAPDVINAHYASGYGFTVALAQMGRDVPILLHLWGSDILVVPQKSAFHRRKTAYALAQADYVIADSQYLLDAAKQLAGIAESRVIPWGLEREFLALHRTEYSMAEPLRVIVPRPHEKIYNNLFLVRSLAPLINSGKVELTFPSFGSLSGHFRMNAATIVDDRLKFYEKQPRHQFMRLMAEQDVYLSGALSDSSPASLIEAMGLGLIPIAADIPGVREWLGPDNGYVYDVYGAGQLLEIMTSLVERKDDHHTMRENNLNRVKQMAVYEDNVASTIEVMHQLAGRRNK